MAPIPHPPSDNPRRWRVYRPKNQVGRREAYGHYAGEKTSGGLAPSESGAFDSAQEENNYINRAQDQSERASKKLDGTSKMRAKMPTVAEKMRAKRIEDRNRRIREDEKLNKAYDEKNKEKNQFMRQGESLLGGDEHNPNDRYGDPKMPHRLTLDEMFKERARQDLERQRGKKDPMDDEPFGGSTAKKPPPKPDRPDSGLRRNPGESDDAWRRRSSGQHLSGGDDPRDPNYRTGKPSDPRDDTISGKLRGKKPYGSTPSYDRSDPRDPGPGLSYHPEDQKDSKPVTPKPKGPPPLRRGTGLPGPGGIKAPPKPKAPPDLKAPPKIPPYPDVKRIPRPPIPPLKSPKKPGRGTGLTTYASQMPKGY